MRRVLKLPAYRRLLIAYVLNELAWLVGSLTLAVLVYRRTGSALGATVFFLCSQFVPALISPLVVARVEHGPAHRVLPALYMLQCVAFLALGALARAPVSLAPLLLIIVCGGTAAVSSRSLVRAMTVVVTSPVGLLREGNALANVAFSICFMLGPAVGGLVVAAGGTEFVLFAGGAVFGLITLMLLADRALPQPVVHERRPTIARVGAALAHARGQPMILAILSLQAVALVFFTISIPVEVVFAQRTLHAGPGGYGALLSAWGAGAVAGSAIYARWHRFNSLELFAIGALLLAIGFVVIAVAPSLGVALGGSAVAGVGNGMQAVSARTALQEATEPQWMAMIMSLNESMFQSMPGVGMLLGGAIAALAGPRTAFAVAGVGSLAIATAAWVVFRWEPLAAGERGS